MCIRDSSYAMPFNLSDKAIIDMDKVEYYISICIQLFNLHCFIIRNDVTKSIEFDYINEDEIEQYFKQACNRLGYDCFTDEDVYKRQTGVRQHSRMTGTVIILVLWRRFPAE